VDLISSLRYEAERLEKERAAAQSFHPDLAKAFGLTDRVAVVTGSGKGIGEGVAVLFAKAGASVVLADVDTENLDRVCAEIHSLGVKAISVPTDVSQRSQVDDLDSRAIAEFGRIDIWANVAGIIPEGMIANMPEERLRQVVDVNLLGTYWGCSSAARVMVPAEQGVILNVSSAASEIGAPNLSGYAMTKAGVNSITRSLALEVGPAGIRVNTVAPGFIDTPMTRRNVLDDDGNISEEKQASLWELRRSISPLGLIGDASDVAYCMLFLASDAARFITGQILRPNGGSAMY
jgi:3-oxoacyl-[acyl-carrier protein] reductase